MTNCQVLIAEDQPKISEILRRFIEKIEGFEVIGIANTIAEADEMLEVLEPDLLLLDVYFPDGNGIDLMWKTRSQSSSLDIIMVTAAKEVKTLQEGIRGGVFDYILKPLNFGRFQDTLLKYQEHRLKLEDLTQVEQQDIDRLLHPERKSETVAKEMPKGIDPLTLEKIQNIISELGNEAFSAESIGQKLGISRTTARRYLEYLAANGFIQTDLSYGTVGRPERLYFAGERKETE